MNFNTEKLELSAGDKSELQKLSNYMGTEATGTDLEKVWQVLDYVWDVLGCDNRKLNWENIGRFYSHPVWIFVGLYIEQDQLSMQHRNAICDWIIDKGNLLKIVDYGGGFGTLARLIASKNKNIMVDIYEPHPSDFAKNRLKIYENVSLITDLNNKYDVLVSTDVLEHVLDPLMSFHEMIAAVKEGGYLIIANCFYPVIKCHLPSDFHFRYSFDIFARLMGLQIIGKLSGSHATIYRKKITTAATNWILIRSLEKVSKILFPFIEVLKSLLRPFYRVVKNVRTPT